jgi:hypothetical protein
MSIQTIVFEELVPALSVLESMAYGRSKYIFRGHRRSKYRLLSTMARHGLGFPVLAPFTLKVVLEQFQAGIAKIGELPFEGSGRQDWLEFARHCGVPTPCIDFTHSPYVALFFAFTEVERPLQPEAGDEYAALLCLDVNLLAQAWLASYGGGYDDNRFHLFVGQDDSFFETGFPESLKLLLQPSRFNEPMQRQLGALVYDLVPWRNNQRQDLEDFIEKTIELPEWMPRGMTDVEGHVLTKILISTKCTGQVFRRLELMNFTGAKLFGDAKGVATDVLNSRYYEPRTGRLRDIGFEK